MERRVRVQVRVRNLGSRDSLVSPEPALAVPAPPRKVGQLKWSST